VLTNRQIINEAPSVKATISFTLIKTNQIQLCTLTIDLGVLMMVPLICGTVHVCVSVCFNETIFLSRVQCLFVELFPCYRVNYAKRFQNTCILLIAELWTSLLFLAYKMAVIVTDYSAKFTVQFLVLY
jgi:hypothetical protein